MAAATQPNGKPMKTSPIPPLLNMWCTIANSMGRVFGSTASSFALTLASALVLGTVRITAEHVMVHIFDWPANSIDTKTAAASVASIFHSLNLVPGVYLCLATAKSYNPSERMAEAVAPWWEISVNALLQFCTGYMLYDGLLNIVWLKLTMSSDGRLSAEDYMFLGHHVATTIYMSSTRILGAGHQSALICMFLGELSNPLHNSFYVAEAAQKLDCCNGAFSQAVMVVVEGSFCVVYTVLRAVVAPVAFLHVTYNLWTVGRQYIHVLVLLMWTLLIWAVEVGSMPWITQCWDTLNEIYFPMIYNVLTKRKGLQSEL